MPRRAPRRRRSMNHPSPQPNVLTADDTQHLSPAFWPMLILTGIGTGLASGLLMRLLRFTQHLAFDYTSGTFLDGVSAAGWERRLLVVTAAGALAGLVGCLIKRRPGHHAGELTVALWFHAGRLAPATVLVRSILSIVIVGMGASLGREAAPKQVGALLGSMTGIRAGLSPPERRLLVACGAGAGMAAVYNVPLGGALFGLEVLLGTLSLPLVVPALLASAIATGASWLLSPPRATYHIADYGPTLPLLAWSVLAGPLAGLASVGYTRLISWADGRKPKGPWVVVAPTAAFAIVGALAIACPAVLGNGKDVVQLAFDGRMGAAVLVALLVLKPVATALCLGSGAPGGLFTPTLAFGALFGAALGHAFALAWPGAPQGACAVIGATAVLAGTTFGPISAVVLVLELTNSAEALLLPMLLATGIATLTARALDPRSIYSGRIHTARQAARMRDETAGGALSSAAGLPEILAGLLRAGSPSSFDVFDEKGDRVGTIEPGGKTGEAASARLGATSAIVTASDLARMSR